MACAVCFLPLSSSNVLFPTLCRRPTFPSIFHRLRSFSSTDRLHSTRNRLSPVRSQAKRGFSVKEDEVASGNPNSQLQKKNAKRFNLYMLSSFLIDFAMKLNDGLAADVEFETPLKIVEYPDPILRAKNKRIASFGENLKNLVDEMFDVMYKTDGIGLSAPQVGINVQLMVFNPVGERGEGEELVLVNPRVSRYSQKTRLFNEGCLSFPGIYADVQRPESVKIDARDIKGARFTVSLSGLPARVFQHEFDHLQGVLFFDRMSEGVLETISAQLQALEKKYEDKTGFPSPERIETRKRMKAAAGFGKSSLL